MRLSTSLTLLVLLTTGSPALHAADPHDSLEASRVAEWVRALPAVDADQSHFSVIGGLSTVHAGHSAIQAIRDGGPEAFYRNASALEQARRDIEWRAVTCAAPLAEGGLTWHRDVQNLPWGLVEPSSGERHWELTDAIVGALDSRGLRYVGVFLSLSIRSS